MDCSMRGPLVPHHFLNFAQVLVYCNGDANQLSHPLTPSSPSALNLSQHQELIQWVSYSHQMTKIWGALASSSVLPMRIQGWFPWHWLAWSPCCPRDSQKSSPAPPFKGINSLAFYLLTIQFSQLYVTTGKTIALTIRTFVGRVMSLLFRTMSRFVTPFLPRSKCLLIS